MIEVNVNKLVNILSKHFGREVMIEEVKVASAKNQHKPERKKIGMGGVLTLFLKQEE